MTSIVKFSLVAGVIATTGILTTGEAKAAVSTEAAFVFNTFSFLVHGVLVMLMAAGFAMLESGLVRAKNTAAICLKNIALYSLAGLMFYTRRSDERGPQVGGPLTRWHYHVWASPNCLVDGLLSVGSPRDGRCARGEPAHRSPEMLHVWFLDHPEGPFATSMWLKPDQLRTLIERDEQRAATGR